MRPASSPRCAITTRGRVAAQGEPGAVELALEHVGQLLGRSAAHVAPRQRVGERLHDAAAGAGDEDDSVVSSRSPSTVTIGATESAGSAS